MLNDKRLAAAVVTAAKNGILKIRLLLPDELFLCKSV